MLYKKAMPCCMRPSSPDGKARLKTEKIDKQLRKEKREQIRREDIILVHGPSGSGKTTFLRQLRILYGKAYSEEEKRQHILQVYQNVFAAIQSLTKAMDKLHIPYGSSAAKEKANVINAVKSTFVLKEPYASYIADLWVDSGIQECYQRRKEYRLPDSTKYFLSEIERLAYPDYLPSVEDIVQLESPSEAMTEWNFTIDGRMYSTFRVIEMDDQQGSRRKWLPCYHYAYGIMAILFFVDLTDYDQVLDNSSDKSQTRLTESINFFRNLQWRRISLDPVFIFLNKNDLFAEKILHTHLGDYFPTYDGPLLDDTAAREHIASIFLSHVPIKSQRRSRLDIYTYPTCATDTENVRYVFAEVHELLWRMRNTY